VYWRKLKLEAIFDSGSSYFNFKRRDETEAQSTRGQPGINLRSTQGQAGVNLGSTWNQPAPPYLGSCGGGCAGGCGCGGGGGGPRIGPSRSFLPRHHNQTQFEHSLPKLNGILQRGEQYLSGPLPTTSLNASLNLVSLLKRHPMTWRAISTTAYPRSVVVCGGGEAGDGRRRAEGDGQRDARRQRQPRFRALAVIARHQGLTLVHFSSQPEPFLKPKHTLHTP
jgi:hypothetical protein